MQNIDQYRFEIDVMFLTAQSSFVHADSTVTYKPGHTKRMETPVRLAFIILVTLVSETALREAKWYFATWKYKPYCHAIFSN